MKIALLALTENGRRVAERIRDALADARLVEMRTGVREALADTWQRFDGIICIMATGIVVRSVVGLCSSKYHDPCVVVVDEAGRYAISLLSGHLGGGNRLAGRVAEICGAEAVITTGSDVSGHTSIDLWALEAGCGVFNPEHLAAVSARLLNDGRLTVYQDIVAIPELPRDLEWARERSTADILVTCSPGRQYRQLQLVPKLRYVGIGCRRGTTLEEFLQAFNDLETIHGVCLMSVAGLATIDLKRDEAGLLACAGRYRLPIRYFSAETLNSASMRTRSEQVYKKVGSHGVSEPAAVLAAARGSRPGRLILEKIKWERITAAVAETVF